MVASGVYFVAEYQMRHRTGSYFFDFAFPKLKLLLEIDSWTYHHTRRQRIRDACKNRFVEENGWRLIRLKNGSKLGLRAVRAVRKFRNERVAAEEEQRMQRLAFFAESDDPEI